MQFTRFTDYAVRVLVYVAQRPDEWCTIRQISDAYDISRNHLMKVVSFLGSEGYLVSQRGPGGGVRLQRPASQVCLGEVILAAEGGMRLLETPEGVGDELALPHRRVAAILEEASEAFQSRLGAYTLADVTEHLEAPVSRARAVS